MNQIKNQRQKKINIMVQCKRKSYAQTSSSILKSTMYVQTQSLIIIFSLH